MNIQNTKNINSFNEENRYSPAPSELYKYSIYNKINEKDEFLKNVDVNINEQKKSKEDKSIISRVLAFGAAVSLFILLLYKKII